MTGGDTRLVFTPGVGQRDTSTGQSRFALSDALGGSRALLGSDGSLLDDLRYDAFGGTIYHGGSSPGPVPLGWGAASGYQSDDSGLVLMGNRYYDPAIGRFLSPDPAKDGDNWYAYCGNDPVNASDPTGLTCIDGIDVGDGFAGSMLGRSVAAANNSYDLAYDVRLNKYTQKSTTTSWHDHGNPESITVTDPPQLEWSRPLGDNNFQLVGMSSVDNPDGAALAADAARSGETSGIGKPGKIDFPNMQEAIQAAKNWLGKEVRSITNKEGDHIFESKAGRKLRFDIKNPSPHMNPHAHMEELINGKWENVVPRIYPSDVAPR